MKIPQFALLPPANVRRSLAGSEWEACVAAWSTLSQAIIDLPTNEFIKQCNETSSLPAFLDSYYSQIAVSGPQDEQLRSNPALSLRKTCFNLVDRIFREIDGVPSILLTWQFVSNFCLAHIKDAALSQTMHTVWEKQSSKLSASLQKETQGALVLLESNDGPDGSKWLTRFAPIIVSSPEIGALIMTGSDFLDTLVGAYTPQTSEAKRKALSNFVYHGIVSLARTEPPKVSLLADHLYSLKTQADASSNNISLLHDTVTNTPLTSKLQQMVASNSSDRFAKLLTTLETYRTPSIARRKRTIRTRPSKGKQNVDRNAELHVHHMSLVTQVQDLFPDLGAEFVLQALNEYNDDVEQTIAHLLDDSLPPHLASLDRTTQIPNSQESRQAKIDHLAPRSAPPAPTQSFIPQRRNVFDDDEIYNLALGTNRLHIGKAKIDLSTTTSDQPNKAAILSALAAFDSDDDERDDTYDVDDVGGTIDTAHPDGEPGIAAKITAEENNMALFTAYKSHPELFGRTHDVRRGQARAALKKETGMTDEAIEGWAIMLQRDPHRVRNLEAQLGAFDGRQGELASTAYRGEMSDTEGSDGGGGSNNAPRGGFRGGRARGRGGSGGVGRGGGGNVAGDKGEPSTAQAQRRKEAGKSSRANHNRRNQRAKKMARGGFPG
jgi:activating signal cointegrator complex subunit 2